MAATARQIRLYAGVLLSAVAGSIVSAWLQGRMARMNPAAMFIGPVFRRAMWGILGLFPGPALVLLFMVGQSLRSPGVAWPC